MNEMIEERKDRSEEDCKGRRGGEYGKGDDWEGMEEMKIDEDGI